MGLFYLYQGYKKIAKKHPLEEMPFQSSQPKFQCHTYTYTAWTVLE